MLSFTILATIVWAIGMLFWHKGLQIVTSPQVSDTVSKMTMLVSVLSAAIAALGLGIPLVVSHPSSPASEFMTSLYLASNMLNAILIPPRKTRELWSAIRTT